MEELAVDLLEVILVYGSTTEAWAVSRTCWKLHRTANPLILPLFRKRIHARLRGLIGSTNPARFLGELSGTQGPASYYLTGSTVWSLLLSEEWSVQDIDCFVPSLPRLANGNYEHEGTRYHVEYGDYNMSDRIEGCIRTISTRRIKTVRLPVASEYEWWSETGYANTIDFALFTGSFEDDVVFDIDGCKCYFTESVLCIVKPAETLYKRSRFKGNVSCPNRYDKYTGRGITFPEDDNPRSKWQ